MARRRTKSSASLPAAAAAALAPHAAQERAQELAKERARLLREVQKKQRQVEQVQLRTREAADQAMARMAPIVSRQRALVQELTALFDELLDGGRAPARARRQLERLRRSLEQQGLLEPRFDESQLDADEDDIFGRRDASDDAWESPPRPGAERTPRAEEPREVAGATQVGQQRRSLRDIFRSLARAIHPDQARQEDERQRRTEVMKQVTRAYEDGDLARLVELESAWQSDQTLSGSGDPELRCLELTRLNRELLDQLREVTRQLRDAKRELLEVELTYPSVELVALASLELDDVEGICELLRRFRDGKISISDLTDGPLPRPRRRKRARP